MSKNRFLTRLVSGTLVVAVAAGAALVVNEVANAAAAPPNLGTLTFTPATGSDIVAITGHTSAACPTTANAANIKITGPEGAAAMTFPTARPYNIVTPTSAPGAFSTTDPFDPPLKLTMKDAASKAADPIYGGTGTLQPGRYDLVVNCIDDFTTEVFGTFTGTLFFTSPTAYATTDPNGGSPSPSPSPTSPSPSPSPSPTSPSPSPSPNSSPTPFPSPNPSPTPEPGVTDTMTTLTVFPHLAFQGAPVILLANVAPAGATGTVRFMDGTTQLGTVPVFNGVGLLIDTLPTATHSLTAVFTPTGVFAASTSEPVSLTVQPIPGSLVTPDAPTNHAFSWISRFLWIFNFLPFSNFR